MIKPSDLGPTPLFREDSDSVQLEKQFDAAIMRAHRGDRWPAIVPLYRDGIERAAVEATADRYRAAGWRVDTSHRNARAILEPLPQGELAQRATTEDAKLKVLVVGFARATRQLAELAAKRRRLHDANPGTNTNKPPEETGADQLKAPGHHDTSSSVDELPTTTAHLEAVREAMLRYVDTLDHANPDAYCNEHGTPRSTCDESHEPPEASGLHGYNDGAFYVFGPCGDGCRHPSHKPSAA